MKVLILAAGYGTRLYALVKDVPKALLEINGKPLVDYILEKIAPLQGLKEIILVTNNKFYPLFRDWAKKKRFPCPLDIVDDKTTTPQKRLGSIGDIDFVLQQKAIQDDLLVIGGDNLFDFALGPYIVFAKGKSPCVTIGLYDIQDLQEARKFGVVSLNTDHKIVGFEEKPQHPISTLIAMCCYYLPEKSLGFIREYLLESKKSDTSGDYIRWLHQQHDVYGFTFTGRWLDIGSIESYKEAQEKFK